MHLGDLDCMLRRLHLAHTAQDRAQSQWGKLYWARVIDYLKARVAIINSSMPAGM
jgi:hypothetical protein